MIDSMSYNDGQVKVDFYDQPDQFYQMADDSFKEIISLFQQINKLAKQELKAIMNTVSFIMKSRCEDEELISYTFDRMLSLLFFYEDDIKDLYDKLLQYTSTFNQGLSNDYQKIYEELHHDPDDDCELKL